MTEIIFCKPVHHYDSYTDFWKLVELSEFPIVRVDEIDITRDGIYITAPMNGDYKEYISGQIEKQISSGLPRLAHLICWNLERPAGSGSTGQYAKDCFEWFETRLVDEVWVSDPALADETQLRYVALGSDYGLGEPSEKISYDFTHMSVEIPRRMEIYKHFGEAQIGQNAWGDERHNILQASKFALNVHQDNYPFCEPLRIALFAAYGLPIISEKLLSGYPYGDSIVQFAYHDLVSGLKTALNDDYGQWLERGLALRELLCDNLQFGKVVRQAVKESVGWR